MRRRAPARTYLRRYDRPRGIDALPEWLDAGPLHGVDEQFVLPFAQFDIGCGDILDDVGHLRVGHCRTDQHAELSILVGLATDRNLIKFLAVLLDAENADMPTW